VKIIYFFREKRPKDLLYRYVEALLLYNNVGAYKSHTIIWLQKSTWCSENIWSRRQILMASCLEKQLWWSFERDNTSSQNRRSSPENLETKGASHHLDKWLIFNDIFEIHTLGTLAAQSLGRQDSNPAATLAEAGGTVVPPRRTAQHDEPLKLGSDHPGVTAARPRGSGHIPLETNQGTCNGFFTIDGYAIIWMKKLKQFCSLKLYKYEDVKSV
jgi:hypothetical protein